MESFENNINCHKTLNEPEVSDKVCETFTSDEREKNPQGIKSEIWEYSGNEVIATGNITSMDIGKNEIQDIKEERFAIKNDNQGAVKEESETDNDNMLKKNEELRMNSKTNNTFMKVEFNENVVLSDEKNFSSTNITKTDLLEVRNTEIECLNLELENRATEEIPLKGNEKKEDSFSSDRNSVESEIKTTEQEENNGQVNEKISNDAEGREKISDFMTLSSTDITENRIVTEDHGELVMDRCTPGSNDELETTVCDKLKNDLGVLREESFNVKTELNVFARNMHFRDLREEILELSKKLSHYLESLKNLKKERCSKQNLSSKSQNIDRTRTDNKSSLDCLANSSKIEDNSPRKHNKCDERLCIYSDREQSEAENHRRKHTFLKSCHVNSNYNEMKGNSYPVFLHNKDSKLDPSGGKCDCVMKRSDRQSPESVTRRKNILKRKHNSESSSEMNNEKKRIRSLIGRQMDLINKYVSKVDDCVKHTTLKSSVEKGIRMSELQSNCDKTLEKKVGSEINTLKEMESFLAFLKERKRQTLDQNGWRNMSKKAGSANQVKSNIVDARNIKKCNSKSHSEVRKSVKVFGTKRRIAERERSNKSQQQTHVINAEVKKEIVTNTDRETLGVSSNNKAESCGDKFDGKINTLKDMESFLSFLRNRKRKSSDNSNKRKLENNTRVKDHVVSTRWRFSGSNLTKITHKNESSKYRDNDFHLNKSRTRLNHSEKVSTSKTQESNKFAFSFAENILYIKKDANKCTPDVQMDYKKSSNEKCTGKQSCVRGKDKLSIYDSALYMKTNGNKLRKKNGILISKRMTSHSKTRVTKSISKQTSRNASTVNTGNKEISLKEMETFLQEHRGKKLKRTNAEEIHTTVLNSEMKEDRHLELSRDRRKAKLMACVMVKPEKISKLLKDLKETKLSADGDSLSNREYKKVLRKIMEETKTISMA